MAALLAFNAAGQKEQWLEYRTSAESIRGYRWLELSTNAPSQVALPQLRAKALYGEWKNGWDRSRWICVDGASRAGGYDRIFFDSNGNGRLDDEKPLSPVERQGGMVAAFPPLKMVFKGEDGPVTYHLGARVYDMEGGVAQLLITAAGWYEGTVDFGGKKRKVELFDYSINGLFNDSGLGSTQADQISLAGSPRHVGKYIEVDNQLYRLDIARDGAFLKVQKAEGVKTAAVKVPETISEIEAVGENGHFTRKPVKGEFNLPEGKYRMQRWAIQRKDSKGDEWALIGTGFGPAADFVAGTEKVFVGIGEPIRPIVEAQESRTEIQFGLKLFGPLDETVNIMRGDERGRAPQLALASLKGSYKTTSTFEYG